MPSHFLRQSISNTKVRCHLLFYIWNWWILRQYNLHHQPSHLSLKYVNHLVYHVMNVFYFCHHIVTMLSEYCDNIVAHIAKFNNTVIIYVSHMWSLLVEISTILWPDTVDIFDNRIVKLDHMIDNIVTICLHRCYNMMTYVMHYCNISISWAIWWSYCVENMSGDVASRNAKRKCC